MCDHADLMESIPAGHSAPSPQRVADSALQHRLADSRRLDALRSTKLLDTPTEPVFDTLTKRAADLLSVPATFISLVDVDRDFYKSAFGFAKPLSEVRQLEGRTFCHYAIASDAPLVIENTLRDPVFREVPTVTTLGVRAYLGIPLVLDDGEIIGSFCAIDFEPRQWNEGEVALMRALADATLAEIRRRTDVEVDSP